jgi:mono/diheme cytochrome c family protein
VQRRSVNRFQDPTMQLRNLAVAIAAAIAFPATVLAQQESTQPSTPEQNSAAPATSAPQKDDGGSAKQFNVKNTFRNICSYCHEDYGRKQGKGPQLMNNPNSDEFLFNRIKNGKPGRMAAFGGVFTDDQIHQIVAFIRELKPGVQP